MDIQADDVCKPNIASGGSGLGRRLIPTTSVQFVVHRLLQCRFHIGESSTGGFNYSYSTLVSKHRNNSTQRRMTSVNFDVWGWEYCTPGHGSSAFAGTFLECSASISFMTRCLQLTPKPRHTIKKKQETEEIDPNNRVDHVEQMTERRRDKYGRSLPHGCSK